MNEGGAQKVKALGEEFLESDGGQWRENHFSFVKSSH